jgi:hypothetical protein
VVQVVHLAFKIPQLLAGQEELLQEELQPTQLVMQVEQEMLETVVLAAQAAMVFLLVLQAM